MTGFFISHSKKDEALRDLFDNLLSQIGQMSIKMEFSDIDLISYQQALYIRKAINTSDAVLLLVGPNVLNSHYTMSWIGFEVGVACAFRKDLVIVSIRDTDIFLPVPYFTHHISLPNQELNRNWLHSLEDWLTKIGTGETRYLTERQFCKYCGNEFITFGEKTNQCPGCNKQL